MDINNPILLETAKIMWKEQILVLKFVFFNYLYSNVINNNFIYR